MSAPGLLYLDSSAIVKLVVAEPGSEELFRTVEGGGPAVSSALAKVEVRRAMKRARAPRETRDRAERALDRIALIKVDDSILERAAQMEPAELRTFDAIHLATALSIRDHLEAFVVYDGRLADAADASGLPIASPS